MGAQSSRIQFHLAFSSSESDGLRRGSDRAPNAAGAETRFRELALTASYGIADSLRGNLRLPYVWLRKEELGKPGISLSGMGDASLYLEWTPQAAAGAVHPHGPGEEPDPLAEGLDALPGVQLPKVPAAQPAAADGGAGAGTWTFLAGVKLPTGESVDNPAPGVVPPSLLQLGSGTFDPLLGVRWSRPLGSWWLYGSALAQLPVGESDARLNPGNTLVLSAGTSVSVGSSLTPSLQVAGLFRSRDYLNGRELGSTGGSIWSLTPALAWRFENGVGIQLSARVPVAIQVNSTQIAPGVRWSAEVAVPF